jgi:hypothetical protein
MVWRKRRTKRMDLGFLKICNDLDEKGRSGLGVGYHVLLCVRSSWTWPSTTGKLELPYPATIATPPRMSSPQEGEQNET